MTPEAESPLPNAGTPSPNEASQQYIALVRLYGLNVLVGGL